MKLLIIFNKSFSVKTTATIVSMTVYGIGWVVIGLSSGLLGRRYRLIFSMGWVPKLSNIIIPNINSVDIALIEKRPTFLFSRNLSVDKVWSFKSMSMMHSVFVYGTLKKGEPNHNWLESKENGHARFISKAKTVKKYPLVIASKYNIPFLLQSAGRGENVIGEVYEVDDKMLSHLDILEDHPTFYVREIDQVQILGQEKKNLIDCWIYFLKKFKLSLLDEQCYVEYHSEGSHSKPYTPREQRIPGYHAKTDVLLS